jgi:hypothetical protein
MNQVNNKTNDNFIGVQPDTIFYTSASDENVNSSDTFSVITTVEKSFKMNSNDRNLSTYQLQYIIEPEVKAGATLVANTLYLINREYLSEIVNIYLKGQSYSESIINIDYTDKAQRLLGPLIYDARTRVENDRYITNGVETPITFDATTPNKKFITSYISNIKISESDSLFNNSFGGYIIIGYASSTSVITSIPLKVDISLGELLPMSYMYLNRLTHLEGVDTLTIKFNSSDKVLLKCKNDFSDNVVKVDTTEANYKISSLKLRRYDYEIYKNIQQIEYKNDILYVPEYINFTESKQGSTQTLDFKIDAEPGSYLLGVIFAAGIKNTTNMPTQFNPSNLGYGNFSYFKIELNNNSVLQFENSNDYYGYMKTIKDKLKTHSLYNLQDIQYYGCIPIFFDNDYENIFNNSYNIARGIELSKSQSVKLTLKVTSFNGSQERDLFALGIKLRPYYLYNGKISNTMPMIQYQ